MDMAKALILDDSEVLQLPDMVSIVNELIGECHTTSSVAGALELLQNNWSQYRYVFVDLRIDDHPTEFEFVKNTAGFIVYFRVRALQISRSSVLPPLTVIYTGNVDNAQWFLGPFMPDTLREEEAIGRPFIVLKKTTGINERLEWKPLLMRFERERFENLEMGNWTFDDSIESLMSLDGLHGEDVHKALHIPVRMEADTVFYLDDVFPVWCKLISDLRNSGMTFQGLKWMDYRNELVELLRRRNWLWHLNWIFTPRENSESGPGYAVIHNSGESKWPEFSKAVLDRLPVSTQARLWHDLPNDSASSSGECGVVPWQMEPWNPSGYNVWFKANSNRIAELKNRWREWSDDNNTAATIIKTALDTECKTLGIQYVPVNCETSDKFTCWIDACEIAEAVCEYLRGQVFLRAWDKDDSNKVVWHRIMRHPEEEICIDIANNGSGFGELLEKMAVTRNSSLASLASRLRGWVRVDVYSREENFRELIRHVSLGSRYISSQKGDWPDRAVCEFPFDDISSLYRLSFRLPRYEGTQCK